MNPELEAFASRVAGQAHEIYVLSMMGKSQKAAEMASALLTEATTLRQQHQMLEEASAIDELDLMMLPAPSFVSEAE